MRKGIILLLLFLLIPQSAYAEKNNFASSAQLVSPEKIEVDNRAKILKKFLQMHNSPLASSAWTFVITADKYDLDWKLVAAISGVESTFAKYLPYNSYNAWGWGIYGTNVIYFSSYDEAIQTISKSLRENYINKLGAKNVYAIGGLYAADPFWSQKVTSIMNRIDEFARIQTADTLPITL